MERHLLIRRAWIAAAVVAAAALAIVFRTALPVGASRSASPSAPHESSIVPAGVRIRVEVLNATRIHGLGRRATMYLRDRGFDVVETSTTSPGRDSTLVLDRSGHPEWARLAARAMGGAPVQSRPDSSHYVDVTVLIGSSWRPPAQPFYP